MSLSSSCRAAATAFSRDESLGMALDARLVAWRFFIVNIFRPVSAQDVPGLGGTWPRAGEGDRKKKAQTRTALTLCRDFRIAETDFNTQR